MQTQLPGVAWNLLAATGLAGFAAVLFGIEH
jgi:hypothetical protein